MHRQANGSILAITEDAQGRFLLSGFVNSYEGQSVGRIFRALPDGAFDPSFVAPLDPFGYSFKIRELGDGRILGVGRYKITGVSDTLGVVRLMADGSLDPSFTPVRISMQDGPLGLVPNVQDAHILADGRMIIGGRFDHINGVARGAIALLNADGSLSDDYFAGPGCGDYSGIEVNYRYIAGIVPAPNGEYYIYGAYMGYDDGTTNYPQQGFVSRLHGFNVGWGSPRSPPRPLGARRRGRARPICGGGPGALRPFCALLLPLPPRLPRPVSRVAPRRLPPRPLPSLPSGRPSSALLPLPVSGSPGALGSRAAAPPGGPRQRPADSLRMVGAGRSQGAVAERAYSRWAKAGGAHRWGEHPAGAW